MNQKLTRRKLLITSGGLLALPALGQGNAFAAKSSRVLSWRNINGVKNFRLQIADQELAPRSVITALAANQWHTSKVITVPSSFDLLGAAWSNSRRSRVQVRTFDRSGNVSKWIELSHSDEHSEDGQHSNGWSEPIWFGRAKQIQLRTTGRPKELKFHFVTITDQGKVKALGSTSPKAKSASIQPTIITRSEWGGDKIPPRTDPQYGEVDLAFVHHTVNSNSYSADESAGIVKAICSYHRNAKGWNDIGYNFLIDQYGQVFEGREGGIDRAVVGAQAQGYNSFSTGVSMIGTFDSVTPSEAALSALADLLAWKLAIHGVPATGKVTVTTGGGSLNRYAAGTKVTLNRISGHRDGDSTSCPGNALYKKLPALRETVADKIADFPTLELALSKTTAYPAEISASGNLKNPDGSAIAGATVKLQKLSSRGYRTIAKTSTGTDGAWTANTELKKSAILRAVALNESGGYSSISAAQETSLTPKISLKTNKKAVNAGGVIVASGKIKPYLTKLKLKVERDNGDGTYTKVLSKSLKLASSGKFSKKLRLNTAGNYRLSVSFAGNDDYAAAVSHELSFKVQ